VVRRLTEVGHEVTGMTRSPEKRTLLEGLGARPVVADALDAAAAQRAVSEARPYLSLGGRAGRKIAGVVSVAVDVTDLQRVERERRHLLGQLITAYEEERRHLAGDLVAWPQASALARNRP
jgi:uncharacterized protein YbjT (DUF2867 family)